MLIDLILSNSQNVHFILEGALLLGLIGKALVLKNMVALSAALLLMAGCGMLYYNNAFRGAGRIFRRFQMSGASCIYREISV
ncbi:MAG: hypothetical protein DRQ65_07695 [Gammaproteobacteria bacterium]|nr:MAG: hypothetical protein DRQ65_07695 [Gammaproteobacteria bacterium]